MDAKTVEQSPHSSLIQVKVLVPGRVHLSEISRSVDESGGSGGSRGLYLNYLMHL